VTADATSRRSRWKPLKTSTVGIAWAKLDTLVKGAELATTQLWG
jgi:hypothetical protein